MKNVSYEDFLTYHVYHFSPLKITSYIAKIQNSKIISHVVTRKECGLAIFSCWVIFLFSQFLKNEEHPWKYYCFRLVYQKSQQNHLYFLLFNLGQFYPFTLYVFQNQIEIFKIKKNAWRLLFFTLYGSSEEAHYGWTDGQIDGKSDT